MKRAALYHRVSTVDQRPELARRELRAVAKQRGYAVARELDIEETGSGATNDRPGLQRVLAAARRGELDAVIVWKLDRLSRAGVLDTLTIVQELDAAGVALIATTQPIDTHGPIGKMILANYAAIAEIERQHIRERTLLGLAGARRRGVRLGRPGRTQLPDVLHVQRRRNRGASWADIARELGTDARAVRDAAAVCLGCGSAPATWIPCPDRCRGDMTPICKLCGNHRGGAPSLDDDELGIAPLTMIAPRRPRRLA